MLKSIGVTYLRASLNRHVRSGRRHLRTVPAALVGWRLRKRLRPDGKRQPTDVSESSGERCGNGLGTASQCVAKRPRIGRFVRGKRRRNRLIVSVERDEPRPRPIRPRLARVEQLADGIESRRSMGRRIVCRNVDSLGAHDGDDRRRRTLFGAVEGQGAFPRPARYV